MGWWEMKDMDDKEIVMTLVSRWPHGLAWKPPPQRRSPFKLQTSNFNVSPFHDCYHPLLASR
jgi:hypothetical protein